VLLKESGTKVRSATHPAIGIMARSPVRSHHRRDDHRRDDRHGDRYGSRDYGNVRRRSRSPRDRASRDLTATQSHSSRRRDDRDRYSRDDRSPDRYDDRYGRRSRNDRRDRSRGREDHVRKRSRSRDRGQGYSVRERDPKRPRVDRDDDYYRNGDRKKSRRDTNRGSRSTSGDRQSMSGVPSHEVRLSFSPHLDALLTCQSAADAEKRKLEERRAKIEAMKAKKQAQESVNSPAAQSSPPEPVTGTVIHPVQSSDVQSPDLSAIADVTRPKFDPKAVTKRASEKIAQRNKALGADVAAPARALVMSNGTTAQAAKASNLNLAAKPTGFGLAKKAGDALKTSSVAVKNATLDDEDVVKRKFELLPELSSEAQAVDNDPDDFEAIRSDDEESAAAHQAALKRAEAQTDVATIGGDSATQIGPADVAMTGADQEEIDPLDAFMNDLALPEDSSKLPNLATGKGSKKEEVQVFNSDDEIDLDAIGDSTDDILAITKKNRKKDIPIVDHSKMDYEPFRKAFYTEPAEFADMTTEELEALRVELDNVKIIGKDVPKPILKWAQGGFGAQILDVIRALNLEKPTPVQAQTLPAIMSGRDIVGIAKTGSGKTLAYLLPMFRHIKDQRPLEALDGPIGLVLAPTRELATQIHRECRPFLQALNLKAVCAYGGAPIKEDIAELKRGAEILVATPGRLIDLLAANGGRVTNLKRVTYVVLDEADRMFDMGFEPQITKIVSNIRPDRQVVLFSATFPSKMENVARKLLKKLVIIQIGGKSIVGPDITQKIEVRDPKSRFHRLLEVLGELHMSDDDARCLIFVERQDSADVLLKELLARGYPTTSIHGGREQIDRDQSISNFKAGHIPVMVATSVAARGLDVKQLKLVINYDPPNHHEDYVHRVGRTGRAGNKGTAITFLAPDQDRFAGFLVKALTDSQQEVPEDLQKLADSFQAKVKSGEVKYYKGGFGGKGIEKLDAARNAEKAIQRKHYKVEGEADEEEDAEEKKPSKAQSAVDALVAKAAGQVKDRDASKTNTPEPAAPSGAIPTALADHLNNALKVTKTEKPEPSSSGRRGQDRVQMAAEAAAKISNRIGTGSRSNARPGAPVDNRGPDAGAFHATLEINDFPQKARWSVTNRTNISRILEETGASITNKGNYYAPGKEPQPGEPPKLYILVEGDTEVVVESAMTSLTRLLREGTIAALEADAKAPASGRYSVI
jgi:ATP-dependent RNA helicase DDX46/PRP5